MTLQPHLSLAFNGHCEEAFRFYAECLNGTVTFMLPWEQSPMAGQAPADWHAKIAHATLAIGDTVIMGSDVPPDRYVVPQGFEVVLQMDEAVAAERVFTALADRGSITLPLQETFWARRFGVVIDRYGIPWSINCGHAEVRA